MKHQWINRYLEFMISNDITDLFFNGPESSFYLDKNKYISTISPFLNSEDMQEKLQDLAFSQNLRLDPLQPFCGGVLEKGRFRWHSSISPASIHPTMSLRFKIAPTFDLCEFDIDKKDAIKLRQLVDQQKNILICGPTGSGKTALLQSLLKERCHNQRVLVFEDVKELIQTSPHWIHLKSHNKDVDGVGEISFDSLLSNALRMRPDRIACGELRNKETFSFFELLLSGHSGAFATMHAQTPEQSRAKLSLRSQSKITDNIELWGVFMERKNPPKVVGIQKIYE